MLLNEAENKAEQMFFYLYIKIEFPKLCFGNFLMYVH